MDETEFDRFYLGTVRRITAQIYALTGDLGEAEDCVHEAFARAWLRRQALAGYDSPEAWVRAVAWRLAINRWRRATNALTAWRRRAHAGPVGVEPVDAEHVALVTALRELPEVQRRAVVLHYVCDLPIQEVARITHAPTGTVKARLARARARLAVLLAEHDLGPPTSAPAPNSALDSNPIPGVHGA